MSSDVNNSANESIEAYIGLENEPEEGGPTICVEFHISIKVYHCICTVYM